MCFSYHFFTTVLLLIPTQGLLAKTTQYWAFKALASISNTLSHWESNWISLLYLQKQVVIVTSVAPTALLNSTQILYSDIREARRNENIVGDPSVSQGYVIAIINCKGTAISSY